MTTEIIGKAEKALASVSLLLAADDSDGATNRAYYPMVDAAMAALCGFQRKAARHSDLIAATLPI